MVFNKFCTEELTIKDTQNAMENEDLTSKELVIYYLDRIAKFDQDEPNLNFY